MRGLDWWGIGVRGLKVPFAQWPTLLAACPPAVAIGVISFFLSASIVGADAIDDDSVKFVFAISAKLALLAFGWVWMTALWHTTLRQVITFPGRRNFWIYFLVFGCVTIGGEAIVQGVQVAIKSQIPGNAARIIAGSLWTLIWLPVVWAILRLSIWPAAIVANQRWVSPVSVWKATAGLAWDFLLLGLVIGIPALILGGGLIAGIFFIAHANHLPIAAELVMGSVAFLAIYGTAAWHAACLLAYHDLIVAPPLPGRPKTAAVSLP